jgi:hypothetical protein
MTCDGSADSILWYYLNLFWWISSISNSLWISPPKKFFQPLRFEIAFLSIYFDLFGNPAINLSLLAVLPSGIMSYRNGRFEHPQLISKVRFPYTTAITNSKSKTIFSNFLGSYPAILTKTDRTALPNLQTSSTSGSNYASTCQIECFSISADRSKKEMFKYLRTMLLFIYGFCGIGTPFTSFKAISTKISLLTIYPPTRPSSLWPIFRASLMGRSV